MANLHANIATGEIYHIFNRGVEKRKIFMDKEDYLRFIHSLIYFNNVQSFAHFTDAKRNIEEVGLPQIEKLVEIYAFCLMPNHYHLMLRQVVENGITEFARKLGTGFTNFFNIKYDRVGPLFQGKYKSVHVNNEAQFIYLPYYIHLNPLDLIEKEWRKGFLRDPKKALDYLKSYKWSSYQNYLGQENFNDVIEKDFLNEYFGSVNTHEKEMMNWLKVNKVNSIIDIIIE